MQNKVSVLLIDDQKDYCFLISRHLSSISNFEVTCASTGKDGLKLAKHINPDIIILDVKMPGLDGFQVLEALKKDDKTVSIPVIMLSGLDDDQARLKASKLYDEVYLTKPVDSHQLSAKIKEILNIV